MDVHNRDLTNAHRALLLELRDGRKRHEQLVDDLGVDKSKVWPRLQQLEEWGWVENPWRGWWSLPFAHDDPEFSYRADLPAPIRPVIAPRDPVDFTTIEIPGTPTKLGRRQFVLEVIYETIRETGYRRDTSIGEAFVDMTSFELRGVRGSTGWGVGFVRWRRKTRISSRRGIGGTGCIWDTAN